MRTGFWVLIGLAPIALAIGLLQHWELPSAPSAVAPTAAPEPALASADEGVSSVAAQRGRAAQIRSSTENALAPAAASRSDASLDSREIAQFEDWYAVAGHMGRHAVLFEAGLEPTRAEYQAFRDALQHLGNESKLRTPYPFFHRGALEAFTRTLFVEPLGLTRDQSRQLAALTREAHDAYLLGVDPGTLSALERYVLRGETVAAIEASLAPVLTAEQAERWSRMQSSVTQIQRGEVHTHELGLGLGADEISDRIQSHWAATYGIDSEAQGSELMSLAQRYFEEATVVLARFAGDEAALRALASDGQSELHREMLSVQVAYEEQAQGLGAHPTADPDRRPPILVRFRYGSLSSISSPLLVAF